MSREDAVAGERSVTSSRPGGPDDAGAYDPLAHATLREEIAKIGDPYGGVPDWERIERLAGDLLATGAKDLLVASYLACALVELRGVEGGARGLELLAGLLERYGDALQPVRFRAKVHALGWYLERLEQATATTSEQREEPWRALERAASKLRAAAQSVLGERTPSFHRLTLQIAEGIRACRDATTVPEVTTAPEATDANDRAAATASAATTVSSEAPSEGAGKGELLASPALPESADEQRGLLHGAGRALIAVACARFAADRTDPSAYRLLRVGIGLPWERLPACNARGRTELDPPPSGLHEALLRQLRSESWAEVLALAEQILIDAPLWLDAHALGARALAKLGREYAAAHALVLAEGKALLARLPGLEKLQFADGTPLASADTLSLLRPPGPELAVGGSEPEVEAGLASLAEGSRERFERALREAGSERSRFRLRLALGAALEAARQPARAAQLYLGLERELEVHALESWEPALARELCLALRRTLGALEDVEAREGLARASIRLARIDPASLLDAYAPPITT